MRYKCNMCRVIAISLGVLCALICTVYAGLKAMAPEEVNDAFGAVRLEVNRFEIARSHGAAAGDLDASQKKIDASFATLEAKAPDNSQVWEEDGNFLIMTEREPLAYEKFQEAVRADANNAGAWCSLGFARLHRGDTLRGLGCMERASATEPGDASYHYTLGTYLYLFRHDVVRKDLPETAVVDQALSELKVACKLSPQDVRYAQDYAETFYSIPVPHWVEAMAAWQHYTEVSLDKDYGAINLARVSLLMGDAAGARRYLNGVTGGGYQELKKKLLEKAEAE
jgi:tetratricopeptide (TPR) repeat protein